MRVHLRNLTKIQQEGLLRPYGEQTARQHSSHKNSWPGQRGVVDSVSSALITVPNLAAI